MARWRSSRASGVRIFPIAMAAQARVSEDSFIRSSPRGSSSALKGLSPPAPAIEPYASKNAIFSVRSISFTALPSTAFSTRRWAPL